MNIKDEIKQFGREHGADLIGFTTAEMLSHAPENHRPTDILPNCKSAVSIAKRALRGTVENDWGTSYIKVMYNVYDQLDTLAYLIGAFIESKGYMALPVPANQPYFEFHPEEKIGRGDISHKHVAQAAGLGVIGLNSLLITPQYGNRVYLTTILTDLAIEPDQPMGKSLCDGCRNCLSGCPAGAIEEDGLFHQERCRSFVTLTLPNGQNVYRCWNCRKVCNKGIQPQ